MSPTRRRFLRALAGGATALAAGCSERSASTEPTADATGEAVDVVSETTATFDELDEELGSLRSLSSAADVSVDVERIDRRSERVHDLLEGDDDATEALRAVATYQAAVAAALEPFMAALRETAAALEHFERFEFADVSATAGLAYDRADRARSSLEAAKGARERIDATDAEAVSEELAAVDAFVDRRRGDLEGVLAVAEGLEVYGMGMPNRHDAGAAYSDEEYECAEGLFGLAAGQFDRGRRTLAAVDADRIRVPALEDSIDGPREVLAIEREYAAAMQRAAAAAAAGDEERAATHEAEADDTY